MFILGSGCPDPHLPLLMVQMGGKNRLQVQPPLLSCQVAWGKSLLSLWACCVMWKMELNNPCPAASGLA